LTELLLVPLEDTVVFPGMSVTLTVDVGDDDRVLLVPKHEGEYSSVGLVADVEERVRLRGGVNAVTLNGLHRAVIGAARTDARRRIAPIRLIAARCHLSPPVELSPPIAEDGGQGGIAPSG